MKKLEKSKVQKLGWILITGLLLMGFVSCGKTSYLEKVNAEEAEGQEEAEESQESTEDDISEGRDTWVVQVSGAVLRPGVFSVPEGTRIYEVIELAGGLFEGAGDSLNQAEFVTDGQKIHVLTSEEEAKKQEVATEEDASSPYTSDGKLRLNYASATDLKNLPGIGDSKANDIIAYREEHGGFQDPQELMQISGIKDGVYNKIKDQIVVD